MIWFNVNIFYSFKKLGPHSKFQEVCYGPMTSLNVGDIRAKQSDKVLSKRFHSRKWILMFIYMVIPDVYKYKEES